jgi:hypothetical protein
MKGKEDRMHHWLVTVTAPATVTYDVTAYTEEEARAKALAWAKEGGTFQVGADLRVSQARRPV